MMIFCGVDKVQLYHALRSVHKRGFVRLHRLRDLFGHYCEFIEDAKHTNDDCTGSSKLLKIEHFHSVSSPGGSLYICLKEDVFEKTEMIVNMDNYAHTFFSRQVKETECTGCTAWRVFIAVYWDLLRKNMESQVCTQNADESLDDVCAWIGVDEHKNRTQSAKVKNRKRRKKKRDRRGKMKECVFQKNDNHCVNNDIHSDNDEQRGVDNMRTDNQSSVESQSGVEDKEVGNVRENCEDNCQQSPTSADDRDYSHACDMRCPTSITHEVLFHHNQTETCIDHVEHIHQVLPMDRQRIDNKDGAYPHELHSAFKVIEAAMENGTAATKCQIRAQLVKLSMLSASSSTFSYFSTVDPFAALRGRLPIIDSNHDCCCLW